MSDGQVSILLVDDRPDKLLALEAVLENLGLRIERAYSGREALRHVLQQEFAVILLDVNMPGMDGFETATLIRQRQSTRDTPIIFITAYADEMHMVRGYSLGAVDYILAPVIPEVLRTKVSVFADLYRQTAQVRRQADLQQQRAAQLQKLSSAAVAINAVRSIPDMLQTVADRAREIVGSHQAIALFTASASPAAQHPATTACGSFSERYADWRHRKLRLDAAAMTQVARGRQTVRLTGHELRRHPDWPIVSTLDIPPIPNMIAAPLVSSSGNNVGVIYLADKHDGHFTLEDEHILTQLAQMTSVALENVIYAAEHEANRAKDEFLATLSHELRTPLNAILGWAQLLRTEELPEEAAHGVEVIERNARAQTKLIEDLLDVSRITAGKLRLENRAVSLSSVIEAAADVVRPSAESRGVHLDLTLSVVEDTVLGDPHRLQQVVWNLLSNAVKFTEAGGRVEVSLKPTEAGYRIAVTDTGKGIPPEFLPFVFDRFRQADSSSTRSYGGLGIGLTIVRHLVELHGGSVSAHSDGLGCGATFMVELPRPAPVAAPAPAYDPPAALVPPTGNGRPELEGLHLLIVDDDPDARDMLCNVLQRCGARVTSAGSAKEALAELTRVRPDVIVSDIAMPEQDGYDLIRAVRSLPPSEGGTTPAIALTAYAREEDRVRAMAAGFQAHVAKPAEPATLASAIGKIRPISTPAAAR